MKAIKITFLQTTNTKPLRLKAQAEGFPAIIENYDYEDIDKQQENLAKKYAEKLKWNWKKIVHGSIKDAEIFVCADE